MPRWRMAGETAKRVSVLKSSTTIGLAAWIAQSARASQETAS